MLRFQFCRFCGIEFQKEMLRFLKNQKSAKSLHPITHITQYTGTTWRVTAEKIKIVYICFFHKFRLNRHPQSSIPLDISQVEVMQSNGCKMYIYFTYSKKNNGLW